jgi:hypothetical protein
MPLRTDCLYDCWFTTYSAEPFQEGKPFLGLPETEGVLGHIMDFRESVQGFAITIDGGLHKVVGSLCGVLAAPIASLGEFSLDNRV